MEDQKILNNEQVKWYEDDDTRLDYQVAFEGPGHTRNQEKKRQDKASKEKKVDIKALLRERDTKWKKRLQDARKAAYAKGFEEGKEDGLQQARKEIDQKIEGLEDMMDQAHQEWKQRQEAINPGLLDLVFELVETIVGLPVGNPQIRENLDDELSVLLHETSKEVKPVIWICNEDYEYVEGLVEKYAPELTVRIRSHDEYNPGEFAFETDKETVVYNYKEMLNDFRENVSVPSWK
ncbi:hypothetical protein LQ318_11985 [Aliifodinibius salicampi]|uniref:Flagellar assembly protein FliH n=1 Tax=Fodinibius salicampi TaxID=1920655 RepID=A0ABT3Q0K5_9BACT|nr:hypothetical protein [Fodinibius salicampi]MCW9713621.1 hypothetical protein [Fodinibius salicampi]